MGKTVVVVGGSLGGMAVTHRLLKYTLPKVEGLKVILITKNSHFYWNLASVRAIVPGTIKAEEILSPIEPGLQKYPAGSWEFILGAADGIDALAKVVNVKTASGDERTVNYDYLVLATGSDGADRSMPWKAAGSYEELVANLHDINERVTAASHVVVAGGGPTGVEVAGELRYAYKDKEILLINNGNSLVGGDSIAASVERELVKMGVQVRNGASVADVEKQEDGKTKIVLKNGETIVTDLYLPTMGQKPNTQFLPNEWLNEFKYADVDDQLRIKAAENVWAAGDIVSKPRGAFLITEAQAATVAKNVELAIQGQEQQAHKGIAVDAFVCSTGRGRTVGRLGPVPLPSLVGWMAKGRTLGKERTTKYTSGSMW